MEDKIKKKLEDFNNSKADMTDELQDDLVIIKRKNDGLFERVDKTLIIEDGRQLLN